MNLSNSFFLIFLMSIFSFGLNQETTNIDTSLFDSTDLSSEETTHLSTQNSTTILTTLILTNESTQTTAEASTEGKTSEISSSPDTTYFLNDTTQKSNFSTEVSSEAPTRSEILTTLIQINVSNETQQIKNFTSTFFSSKPSNISFYTHESSIMTTNETCETFNETTTGPIVTESVSEFNTFMEISGLVRSKRKSSAKLFVVKSNRVLFIEDTDITIVEQAILDSLQKNATLTVKNEGSGQYSIDLSLILNTASNGKLSLDDSLVEIINKLEKDEQKINTEANKVGFDLNIDPSNAIISANETLVINGTTYLLICTKSLGQSQMSCERMAKQNGTFVSQSTSQIQVVSSAFRFNYSIFIFMIAFLIIKF